MTRLLNGRSRDLRRPPIADINALAAAERERGKDLIDLGQAVLGLPPPPAALARVQRYLAETPVHVYAPDPGLPEAREAVAEHLRRRKAVTDAQAAEVMLTCGANQAFVNALLTLTRPGDEVITFGPGYFDHDFAIRLAHCVNVEVPLEVQGPNGRPTGFRFDIERVAAAVTPRTRVVVLVSPGNPTGAVIAATDRQRLQRLCREHELWLVSDETYDLLTFPPATHESPAATGPRDRTVVLGSFSKVFSLAAWRAGYLFGPASFIEETVKAQDAVVVCAPVPSQQAALGALQEVDAYTAHARETLQRRRDLLLSRLQDHPRLAATRPHGGTFVFARLIDASDDVAFCKELVTRVGIVTVPGSAFGPRGAGWVRLSYGNQPSAILARACDRLDEGLG